MVCANEVMQVYYTPILEILERSTNMNLKIRRKKRYKRGILRKIRAGWHEFDANHFFLCKNNWLKMHGYPMRRKGELA